ncbi:hypothetical protein H072_9425 [Dactylellina haptotyla CBS 200.50]|uniref:RBR-type E3 ubiquitin transferase n=1 Tax=Dactylellina haptotyla (strain CBS 200.50) TaxID=1284197 RepID=S8BP63_DACHA|nr:hypothetical protein H072_9425 [Dactylellina haptotyla CBS 200.50]
MEVIQLGGNAVGVSAKHSSGVRAHGGAGGHRRQSQVSLLIASNPVSSPYFGSAPVSIRYSCNSSASSASPFFPSPHSSSSSPSSVSGSSTFFLNDDNEDDDEDDEVSSRSNTSSPGDLPSYITSTAAAASYEHRRTQYRSSSSSSLSRRCNPLKRSVFSPAVPCGTNKSTAGVPGSKAASACATPRPVRSSSLDFKPDSLVVPSTTSSTNCPVSSSSQRTDTGSRLSWYNPLLSERFQLSYVHESAEELSDIESCDSSDTEEPGDGKSVPLAIQESILYFNTISDIPVPAFVEKRIRDHPSTLAPPKSNSQSELELAHSPAHPRQTSTLSVPNSSHVKKPSLVLLDTSAQHSAPILDQDPDSFEDPDSLYNLSYSASASKTTSDSLLPSKEAAEAYAREQIDLEIEAALEESKRLEDERKAREAEEDAEFLQALHDSIIAEKEAQARREDLEFIDKLFSRRRRPASPFSDCSSISSRSSLDSCRYSTVLTALSPPPPKSPIKVHASANTSPEMPSTAEDLSTPLSHNSRERPISAIRERKPKGKASAGDLYEALRDGPSVRPNLQRASTSTSGGFKRLLGLSGKSIRADNSEEERYHARTPRSTKKGDERPSMDRHASESSVSRSSQRHHRHHHRHHSDEVERESSSHRSHRHHHHRHSEGSSPVKEPRDKEPRDKEPRDKRRSKDKPRALDDTPSKRPSRDRILDDAPAPVSTPAATVPAEIPMPEHASASVTGPEVADISPVKQDKSTAEKKKRRKRHASLGDILRVSRKLKAAAPSEPAAPPEPPKMVECVTCMSDDIPETEAAQLECGHAFCNECLVRLFDLSLTDPAHMPPRCCQPTQHIPLQHVDKLLSTKTKILWNKKYQEFTTVNRRYCPATDCGEWVRPKDFTTVEGIEIGTCPRCKLQICGLCGLKEHGKEECPKDEFLNQVRELGKELGWQRCYSCRAMVELERGCNHMTCRCTAEFCMICGLKWKTCECPWFNFPPEEDDAPAPRLNGDGRLVDDLAWGWEPHNNEDERAARQLAADFAEIDVDERDPHSRSAWAPLFSGAIGEGVMRLLGRTRHLEGAALDRLRHAYANAFDDDFMLGDSDGESEDEVTEFMGGHRGHQGHSDRPTPRAVQTDDHERRRRNRDSTYNLDWSPHQSREDLHGGGDFGFLPQLTRAFLPRMFGGHHHHQHHHGDGEFGIRRAFTDGDTGGFRDDIGRYGDLLEGDLNRMRREFDSVNWGGVGAA